MTVSYILPICIDKLNISPPPPPQHTHTHIHAYTDYGLEDLRRAHRELTHNAIKRMVTIVN